MSETKPRCGECGADMALKSSRFGPFWGCTRWPDCNGTHGAHPDGTPLGTPADAKTRAARMEAHAAFDAALKARGMRRMDDYRWLSELTGKTRHDAHISRFNAEECHALAMQLSVDTSTDSGREE